MTHIIRQLRLRLGMMGARFSLDCLRTEANLCRVGLILLSLSCPTRSALSQAFLPAALATRNWISLLGNSIYTDSYNSQMPGIESDTNGNYNASIYHGDKGNIACNGGLLSDSVSIGNADIYGHVSVGPNVPVTLGPSGGIGAYAWRAAGNNGIEPGWLSRDSNFAFPDTSPPAGAGMWNGLPGGDWVVGLSVASRGTNSSTYPSPVPSGLSTNYLTTSTTTGTYPAPGTYVGTVTTNNNGNGTHSYTYNFIIGISSYSWTFYSTNYLSTNYYTSILTDNGQYQAAPPAGMTVGTNYVMGTNVSVYLPAGLLGTEHITYATKGAYLVGPDLAHLAFVNVPYIPSMTIYCGGTSVAVSGNNIANPYGYPLNFILLCAPSVTTINITGNGTYIGIIVAPNADLTLKGSGSGQQDFSGAILCNTALVEGHFGFHFDESLFGPPLVTTQPLSQTVTVGQPATFSVSALGPLPLYYQWQFAGTNILGATSASFTIPSASASDAGNYSVIITNAFGSVTSSNAVLTVNMPPACVTPAPGLVSWWRGEGNANDTVGGNSGVLLNGATYAPGMVGQAFSFDGTNSYVRIADSPSLHFTNALTIEAWIYPTSLGTAHNIVSKWDLPDALQASYTTLVLPDGRINLAVCASGDQSVTPVVSTSSTNVAPGNQWTHFAATYDGSALRMYLNGVCEDQVAYNQGVFPGTDPLAIGAAGAYAGGQVLSPFAGLIDEPAVYNRALTGAEILAIYNAGSAGKCQLARRATATATLANDFVVGANLTDGGYGYTNVPLVRLISGGGSGAEALAVVSNGVVTGITILDAGIGYTNAPLVVIEPPFIPNPILSIVPMSCLAFSNLTIGAVYQLQQSVAWYWSNQPVSFTATNSSWTQLVGGVAGGGDYRLALAPVRGQAFATPQVVNGFVVGATVTSGGSGYVTNPAVSILGGGGTNATAVANVSGGVVTSITITDAGIDYTSPEVRIAPPPADAVSPAVVPVMRLDSAGLAPYDSYQIQFKPDLGGTWGNWSGGAFSPTDVTATQFVFITNKVGFFRLQYLGVP